ncbi:MAG: radical SAM protein [Thermodesulfobacteriota bacterium]
MKYLFGPVNSRRLGLSLGIDLVPPKVCNFNCIYCEVGPTTLFTCERHEYSPTAAIIAEIDAFLASTDLRRPVDVFTLTGSGEPTLHSGLADIIGHIKKKTNKPVAVLTNGSLLHLAEVRSALYQADIVIPSLDAAREESFRKVNRPAPCNRLEEIITGLALFCAEFTGELWLEVLLVKGINDTDADIAALRSALARIKPARIQLNTVARPPLESFARPLNEEELTEIGRRLPGIVEVIADFRGRTRSDVQTARETELLEMLKRRPCTETDICEALNLDHESTAQLIQRMRKSGLLVQTEHRGRIYYQTSQAA